jgi:hypothetical protein
MKSKFIGSLDLSPRYQRGVLAPEYRTIRKLEINTRRQKPPWKEIGIELGGRRSKEKTGTIPR